MATDLRIWLLGGFRTQVGGREVADEEWRRNRAKAVVKLLALSPGHRLHREQITEQLWPELGPDAAAANLRKAIHFARAALSAEHVRLRGELVALQAWPLWVDVDAFEAAAQTGEPAAAISLYGGELLPEDRFEPWTETRREQLRATMHQLLLEAATEDERAGDMTRAAEALQRVIAGDPLNEEAHLALIRVQALSGQRHLALRSYQLLESLLRDELGVAPSQEVAELHEMIRRGDVVAAVERPEPGQVSVLEERKLVTVVMADVTASTGAGLDLDPEVMHAVHDRCVAGVTTAIEAWGGAVQRLRDNAVIALFGVPSLTEDHAARALHAALAVVERVAATPPISSGSTRVALQIRVGVSTGEVIVGPGAAGLAVAGEAVNLAARLQELAQPGEILVGDRTRLAAPGSFQFDEPRMTDLGSVNVRWRRLTGLGTPESARVSRQGRLVGRDSELEAVVNLAAAVARTGQPRLILISGPAGVGKSRLVAEAVSTLRDRDPGLRVLHGRCLPAGHGISHWALAEILRDAFSIAFDETAERVQRKLREGVATLLAPLGLGASEQESTVFALATTAGIVIAGNPLERLESQAVADELARAWPRFVTALVAVGPAVLVVEDIHWAGVPTLQMLELIMARSRGPLTMIATTRPELADIHPDFGRGSGNIASIALQPLTTADSQDLLDALAAVREIPGDRRQQILDRAEGNPYFLEELVAHLGDGRPGALPDTLLSLLGARIDSLPAMEKRVLQEAAVVGRIFWAEPLTETLGWNISQQLTALERRGLILGHTTSRLTGPSEYSFKHALLRDVAYASLPRARRAPAHADVATWIEALTPGRFEEFAELIAHHCCSAYETGGDVWHEPERRELMRRKGFEALIVAGTVAMRRVAVTRAFELHRRALELAGRDSERVRGLEALGDDAAAIYHGDEARDRYQEALAIVRADPGENVSRGRLCWKLAVHMAMYPGAYRLNPDPAEVERLIAEGLDAGGDEVNRAHLLLAKGAAARLFRGSEPFGQGQGPDPLPIEERIAAARQAMTIGESRGLDDLAADAGAALGLLFGIAGRYAEMVALARRRVAGFGAARSQAETADALRALSVQMIEVTGDFEEGLDLAWQAHALSRGTSPHQRMHATWALLAAMYQLGRWAEMLPLVEEHVAAFREDPATVCTFVRDGPLIGATACLHAGEVGRGHDLASLVGDPLDDLTSASAWQSRYALSNGDAPAARLISAGKAFEGRTYGPQHGLAYLEALVAQADWVAIAGYLPRARDDVAGNALLAPVADRADGLAQAAAGRTHDGVRLLNRAADGFLALRVPFEVCRTQERLAEIASDEDRGPLLAAALAGYRRLGATPSVARVHTALSSMQPSSP